MDWDRNKFYWNNRLHGLKTKIPFEFHLKIKFVLYREKGCHFIAETELLMLFMLFNH